jgi:hypothetical protein
MQSHKLFNDHLDENSAFKNLRHLHFLTVAHNIR